MNARADGNLIFDTAVDPTGFQQGTNNLESKAKGFVKRMVASFGVISVAAAALSTIKVGVDYEAQLSRVKAISGATAAEMKALDDLALKLGADTSFSATEAAKGMENLASAGFNAKETMEAMPGLLDLAAVSGGDVAASSEVAASTLRAFAMDAEKAGHVADVFAAAAARTNAETADMGEAMKYVAPVSHAMGISMEETAAAIGIMSDAGIKGSEAGTSLRGVLSRLAKPSKFATKVMEDLGLKFYDANGKMKPLKDQVEMLQSSFVGLTDQQKQNALVTLYGQESLSGMLALIDAGPDKLNSLTTSFMASDGAAKDMADTMRDNLKGNLDNLMGSLESLQIKIFKSLKKALNTVVVGVGDGVQYLLDNFDKIKSGLKGIITVLKIIAPTLGALYIGTKVVKAVKLLRNAWYTAKAALVAYEITQALMPAQAAKLGIVSTVIGVITGRITLATVAQMAWNAALSISPVMWVAGAIGLLITAVVGYNAIIGKTKTEEETERLEKLTIAASDAAKSIDEAREAGQKMADEGLAELAYTSQLKDELDGLVDANGRVKTGYENRVRFIAGELTKATGIEIALQDGVIKGYDKLSDKIDEYIQKKRAQIWLDANEEAYKKAIKEQQTLLDGIKSTQQQVDAAQAAFDSASKSGRESVINKASTNLAEAKSAAQSAQDAYVGALGTIKDYESDAAAILAGKYQDVINAHNSYSGSVADMAGVSKEKLTGLITSTEADLSYLQQLYKTTGDENVKNAIDEKTKTLAQLNEKLDGMTSTVDAKAPAAKASGSKMGEAILDGIKKGVDDPDKKQGLFSKIVGIMGKLVGEGRKSLGIHSPSQVFRKAIGWMVIAGMNLGLTERAKGLYKTMDGISNKLLAAAPMIDVGMRVPKLPSIASGTIIPAMATVKARMTTETNIVMQKMMDKLDRLEMRDIKQIVNFNQEVHTPADALRAMEAMLGVGLAVNR